MTCFSNPQICGEERKYGEYLILPCFLHGASAYSRGHCLGGQETEEKKYKVVYLCLMKALL